MSVLDRFLDPLTDCLTPDVAQRIVELRPDAQTQTRLNELRQKANEGKLSAEEQIEYEEFIEGIDLIGILKAKARRALEKHMA